MHPRRVSLYAFARAKVSRLLKLLLATMVATVSLLLAGSSVASTPPTSSLTVPSSPGQTVTSTWTGMIPPGVNPTSSCAGIPDPLVDKHEVTVNVPAGAYITVDAAFKFTIEWADALDDEILTVLDPQDEEVDSSDGGTNVETVNANNLPAGTYKSLACAFASGNLVTYTGKLEITTTARSSEPSLPSAPAQGLAFTASVAADNQRDQAEPLLEIDKEGFAYDCGPTGFSNASDYAQVSPPNQHGDQFHLLGTPPRGQQSSGGGGDCGLAFGTDKNSLDNYTYAYTGLGPLTGFATSSSEDNGRTLLTGSPFGNGITNQGGGADRQWMTFVDVDTVLLIYNQQQPRNVVVQQSDNGGLLYGPIAARATRSTSPSRRGGERSALGRIAARRSRRGRRRSSPPPTTTRPGTSTSSTARTRSSTRTWSRRAPRSSSRTAPRIQRPAPSCPIWCPLRSRRRCRSIATPFVPRSSNGSPQVARLDASLLCSPAPRPTETRTAGISTHRGTST
jgi:hypothetical protein